MELLPELLLSLGGEGEPFSLAVARASVVAVVFAVTLTAPPALMLRPRVALAELSTMLRATDTPAPTLPELSA